jgi:hypothetical protein
MKAPAVLLIALLFLLLWIGVITGIGFLSGWQRLATRYRAEREFHGKRWRFQSGRMRWGMGYNNCLTAGADGLGLYLSLLFLFRAGHPPLFVRWQDLNVAPVKGLFFRGYKIEFRSEPGLSLSVSERLGDRLRAEAGHAWPQRG